MHLDLWHERFFDLPLDSPEHERPKDLVELFNYLVVLDLLFLISEALVSLAAEIEPFIEIIRRGEDLRQQEVEQTPKLVEVVLEWRTSQK